MTTIFSETLKRLRKEAGFPTAYRFYHGNGGAPAIKMTYRRYLSAEQGESLPSFAKLHPIITALRIPYNCREANELLSAWLRTMAGDEDYGRLLAPMLAEKPSGAKRTPLHGAMERELAKSRYHISPAQLAVIADNRDNYVCFLALSNDTGAWTARDLAPFVKLGEAACGRALEALAKRKLLTPGKNRTYRCPLAGKMLEYPPREDKLDVHLGKLIEYQMELIENGTNTWARRGIIRADAHSLCSYFPLLNINISAAFSYAINEKTNHSALYAVESRVVKLRDF